MNPSLESIPLQSPEEALLRVRDVTVRFGGIVALDQVTFDVPKHKTVGLIGPNGAGKTTLFNCLSRLYEPTSGAIELDGLSVLDLPAHAMAARGIGRTFQNLALFPSATVFENIQIGSHTQGHGNLLADVLGLRRSRRVNRAAAAAANELIAYLHLGDVAHRRVAELPFGTQKRVEFARALAMKPRLLLLDEPACGLNHEEVEGLATLIRSTQRDFDLTVLLVEHHMGLVMGISDWIVALNFGRKIAAGTPSDVQGNPEVIAAYLGETK